MDTQKPGPDWLSHLKPDEQARVIALDRMIALHRELMRPLFDERRRLTRVGNVRRWRRQSRPEPNAA